MDNLQQRTIALAGMIQACILVQKLARTGDCDDSAFSSSMQSVLVLDAMNAFSVYGGKKGIELGLKKIAEGFLHSNEIENVEVIRYVMHIMTLQKKIFINNDLQKPFTKSVESLSGVSADDLIDACAKIYKDYISPLKPQIIIQGDPAFLQRVSVPQKIRCQLLAAIRSSVLWQQKSGNRWTFIWQRSKMREVAKHLIEKRDI